MKNIIRRFKDINIAVVGDLMLDKYIIGKVERISPEAPIPVVSVHKEKFVAGGAANVAANIATLNGNAKIFGVVGKDEAATTLSNCIENLGIDARGICSLPERKTIQKIRIIGQSQQLLRVDYEDGSYIGSHAEKQIIMQLSACENLQIIIVSDYAKGTITSELMQLLKKFATEKNIKIIVDPKPKHKEFYQGVSLITPNQKEAQELSGIILEKDEDFLEAGAKLTEEFHSDIIITAGDKGMYVFPIDAPRDFTHIPTVAREVYDVSGAGDTVIATLSLALASGANLAEAAKLANIAAGIKVSKIGTAPVHFKELSEELSI
jgi:rfaE bifunctional protein kinase chain/domain